MINNSKTFKNLEISRKPLFQYGTMESFIRGIREHNKLDLNAETWRKNNPEGTFPDWQNEARSCLLNALHYDPGRLELKPEVHEVIDRNDFIMEKVSFNTTPWCRLNGYFLLPKNVEHPVPGLVVFHDWGGPMIFGKERIIDTGRDHPVLKEHREKYYSGKYLAEEFVKNGFAVITIDAFHFGERVPKGLFNIPEEYDPFDLSINGAVEFDKLTRNLLYFSLRQLNWAGTTWAGMNFGDDSRCVDYLLTRQEVDPEKIGCTGLSGGGWRTNMLAALDNRIKASVSGCWMTTGDYQQVYNVYGCVGPFCLLPGIWNRMDVPDLTIMSAPCASMVVSTRDDPLFPVEGQNEADRQTRIGFEWAGCPEKYSFTNPPKPHCYDKELQEQAVAWFKKHLK